MSGATITNTSHCFQAANSNNTVKTHIIPTAGHGTRLDEATYATSKNLHLVGGRPLILPAVEEALLAGAEQVVLVCSEEHLEAYKRQFDPSGARRGAIAGKPEMLENLQKVEKMAERIDFVVQDQSQGKGLGYAVSLAYPYVPAGSDVAILLPDDYIVTLPSEESEALSSMLTHYQTGTISVACLQVPPEAIKDYGCFQFPEGVDLKNMAESTQFTGVVEKPSADVAPSNVAAMGRYILPYGIFEAIQNTRPDKGGETQLTDAIDSLRESGVAAFAAQFKGQRFDCGKPEGLGEANFLLYLNRHPELLSQPKFGLPASTPAN
jgi:UTP--glucose-1-phosphate uridylyltransferase